MLERLNYFEKLLLAKKPFLFFFKVNKLKEIAGRDLAVLKLSESIAEFNDYIRPIYLVNL